MPLRDEAAMRIARLKLLIVCLPCYHKTRRHERRIALVELLREDLADTYRPDMRPYIPERADAP